MTNYKSLLLLRVGCQVARRAKASHVVANALKRSIVAGYIIHNVSVEKSFADLCNAQDHQIAAWKTEHKVECKALQALEWYTKKDWTVFHGWFSF